MQKIAGIVALLVAITQSAVADHSQTHLENLKKRYPFGLIGDDYGLLTQEDLAINTCNVLQLTPFPEEKNMAYPYWQCFRVKDTKFECDSLGYDSVTRKETGYMAIDAIGNGGLHSYLARDAIDMRGCRKWRKVWKQKTYGQQYVCLSGSYGAYSGVRAGLRETGWVFDKFKTRKGCESFFVGECSLKKQKKESCLLPNG